MSAPPVQAMNELGAARQIVGASPFFSALPPAALDELVARLVQVDLPKDATVVRQGEEGDHCYLVVSGQVQVWVSPEAPPAGDGSAWSPRPQQDRPVARLGPGGLFGEMALLTGEPRRATVLAVEDCSFLVLDRATFADLIACHRGLSLALENELVLRTAATFLGTDSPFVDLPPEALRWLASRAQVVEAAPGDVFLHEGDAAGAFYVLRWGSAEVVVEAGGGEMGVAVLGPGDPFGEQALLTGAPRSATVRALEPSQALRLGRQDFLQVLREHQAYGDYFQQLMLRRQRPRRIDSWEMREETDASGKTANVLTATASGHYLRLSEQGAFLWGLMDGDHPVRDLALAYFHRYGTLDLEAVTGAVLQFHASGFVELPAFGQAPSQGDRSEAPSHAFWARLGSWMVRYYALPDSDGTVGRLYQTAGRWFYFAPVQWALAAAATVGVAAFLALLLNPAPDQESWGAKSVTVALALAYCLHLVLHEVAHALTCKHFGRKVQRAGAGWYLFMPAAFADTTDIWMAGKWPRIAVSLAGPYMHLLLASFASLAALVPGLGGEERSLCLQLALLGYTLALVNLNPLTESDGYYVLMDMLDIPNLRAKALSFWGALIWRRPRESGDKRLGRLAALYGLLALVYTGVIVSTVVQVYHLYLEEMAGQVLAPPVAATLGWFLAGLMVWVILRNTWRYLQPRGALEWPSLTRS